MIILAFFAWLTFFATTHYLVAERRYQSTDIRYIVFCLLAAISMALFQFIGFGFSIEIREDLISTSVIATALFVFLVLYPTVRNIMKSEE